MMYGKHIIIASILTALIPSVVSAQVVVSEVMYDLEGSDAGREWIEVYNSGSSAATLSEWKIFEGETNHSLIAYSGSETLGSSAYAIIADNPTKFLEDHPAFTGPLFDSAFSLSNTGETLTLRCCLPGQGGTGDSLVNKDTVFYNPESGAAGDGNSLHRTSVTGTSFIASSPTPGTGQFQNAVPGSGTTSDGGDTTAASSGMNLNTGASSVTSPSTTLARASAGNDRTVIVGIDSRFEGKAYDTGNRPVEAQFRWNFGDGTAALGQTVTHQWEYPGRYAVVLEVARFETTVSHRITVSAEVPQLSFEVQSDGGVLIVNLSNRELDISGWRISDKNLSFTFSPSSIVLRNASIRLSSSGLRFSASSDAKLLYSNGEVAPYAPISTSSSPATGTGAMPSENPTLTPLTVNTSSDFVIDEEETGNVPVENMEVPEEISEPSVKDDVKLENIEQVAAVAATDTGERMSLLWWAGLLLVVGLGSVAVFLGRRIRSRKSYFEQSSWNIIEDTDEKV